MDQIESCERTCTALIMISSTDYYANTDFLPKCVVLPTTTEEQFRELVIFLLYSLLYYQTELIDM